MRGLRLELILGPGGQRGRRGGTQSLGEMVVLSLTGQSASGQPQNTAPGTARGVHGTGMVAVAWRGFVFGLHRAGLNHDPLPSSCGPDHVGMCGIVIVYRISSRLSRRDNGVFCLVEAFHPLTTMLARPSPSKRGVHGAGCRRGLQSGKASDETPSRTITNRRGQVKSARNRKLDSNNT